MGALGWRKMAVGPGVGAFKVILEGLEVSEFFGLGGFGYSGCGFWSVGRTFDLRRHCHNPDTARKP